MSVLSLNNKKISMILIVSMMFIAFTKLRLFNLPVGLGELSLLFLGFISFKKIYKLNKVEVLKSISDNLFVKFWLMSFFLLLMAYIWIHATGIHHTNTNVIHDILAYGFVFYILILFIILNKYHEIDFEIIVLKMIYYTVLLYFVLMLITLFFDDTILSKRDRFIGFSNNPNQLALLYTVIPFLLIHFFKKDNINFNKKYIIYFLLLSVLVVIEIKSRGLLIAWFISISWIIYYMYYRSKLKANRVVLNFIFVLFLGIVAFNIDEIVSLLFKGGIGGFSHRMELWSNALELIQSSFLIGFGPGAHVSSVVNTTHYWEVHNTFIDFTLQTGIIGLLLYLFLLYKIGKNLIKNGNMYLMGAFIALIVFSTFHFVFRQPIFWFYLFYFYQMGREKKCVE